MGEISETDLEKAMEGIHIEMEFFNIEPLNSAVVHEAINLFNAYGKSYGIRTLDSLQIATFGLISEKEWIFVAADEVLCKLVTRMGYRVINPEKEDVTL